MLKKMQAINNPILSLKHPNRTSLFMNCLEELVEFVMKKLDSEQIDCILEEVESSPKITGQPPKDKFKHKRWEDWWAEKLADKPEFSNEQKMLFNVIGNAIYFEKAMKKDLDCAFDEAEEK